MILNVDETSGCLELKSRLQVLEDVRKNLRRFVPPGSDLAGELIRDREAEAARDAAEDSGKR